MELKEKLDFAHMDGEPLETIESLQAELNNSPFRLWSEHGFDDGVTWTYYKDFREALNLTGWPYTMINSHLPKAKKCAISICVT